MRSALSVQMWRCLRPLECVVKYLEHKAAGWFGFRVYFGSSIFCSRLLWGSLFAVTPSCFYLTVERRQQIWATTRPREIMHNCRPSSDMKHVDCYCVDRPNFQHHRVERCCTEYAPFVEFWRWCHIFHISHVLFRASVCVCCSVCRHVLDIVLQESVIVSLA